MATAVFTVTQLPGRQVGGCAGLLLRLVSFVVCDQTTERSLIISTHHLHFCHANPARSTGPHDQELGHVQIVFEQQGMTRAVSIWAARHDKGWNALECALPGQPIPPAL